MKKIVCLFAILVMMIPAFCCAEAADKPVIGISWSYAEQEEEYVEYYDCVIEAAGGTPYHIPQVTSSVCTYEDGLLTADMIYDSGMLKTEYAEQIKECNFSLTNVEEAMNGVDAVFFVGGEDISPSLFAQPQTEANNGEDINATRDVSDYILMAYCIENDIPVFAVCRGEQLMGIVSGCQFIQDIPNYYAMMGEDYPDTHRMPADAENRDYARHDVDVIDEDSLLYGIMGTATLSNVSSWHHQAIASVKGTNLNITATTTVNGVSIIEGIERTDKTFCVAVQFHPENDVYIGLSAGDTSAAPCDYDTCLSYFEALVEAAAANRASEAA